MRQRLSIAAGVLLMAAYLVGCEDAGKKPVQAHVPALSPALANAAQAPAELALLPVQNPPHRYFVWLLPPVPSGRDYLIQKVEAKFASGEQNFKAGHLEAARKEFDDAVDWMLESGYDPNGDPKLSELFHRVVDTVYAYELQAFRAGDGFSEAPAVPAAIDEVAEMTFPVDPRLKERAEEAAKNVSHDMPLTVNDQVLSFVNFFQTPRGRAIVETGLRRAGRYREMISRVLREEGLPQDLIYLAQAESAFQPLALSRAGARGIWQFVAYRGQEYGLRHTWWIDERQDPEKATHAAAQHLRDLYRIYGDWYLAMAAYNCGPGNVQKGIERTGYADFWELYKRNVLPRETKNYVPIIIALTLIAKDAAHYNILVDPDSPVPTDVVKPGRAIDLRLVAETIDVDVETLRSLNPSLLRLATPDDPSFELHLPPGHRAKILRGNCGYSAGQMGQLAASSRGERRDAHVHRQEISRDGGGHRRRQQPGAQCRARCRRETDHSSDAAAIGNKTPPGKLSRAPRRHVFGNRRPLQRECRRPAKMESFASQQSEPWDGTAHLHAWRGSGKFSQRGRGPSPRKNLRNRWRAASAADPPQQVIIKPFSMNSLRTPWEYGRFPATPPRHPLVRKTGRHSLGAPQNA